MEFRDEFRSWLSDHPPPEVEIATTREEAEMLREWQRTLHSGHWVGINWPIEHGGRGASPAETAIYNEELALAGAPPLLGRGGISLVGPTLMAHGTERQRRQWMPKILTGEDVWCQLFSEPDAGSDLASLKTRAEKRDGVYVVNGQKVWSSYAQFADFAIALVRTEPTAPGHRAISMLAIPMTSEGLEVRPLRQITGKSEFNEIFLDGVVVPVENLIGPEHEGWRVAATTLANERGASFIWREQVIHKLVMDRLIERCSSEGLLGDSLVRQRLVHSWIEVEILRLHNARTLARLALDQPLGPESSTVKLFWARCHSGSSRQRRRRSDQRRFSCPVTIAPSTRANGLSGCSRRVPTRSWAARARSSATSSPNVCSAFRESRDPDDRGRRHCRF